MAGSAAGTAAVAELHTEFPAIPNSRLERIDDSYVFVSEDQPEQTAELIARFVRETPVDGR